MSGIFDLLPDLGAVTTVRDSTGVRFQDVASRTPTTAGDILGSLVGDVEILRTAAAADAGGATQRLVSFLETSRTAVDLDLGVLVQGVADAMEQIRGQTVRSALGALVNAVGESRSLRDILLEQLPALTEQVLSALTETRDQVLSVEGLQTIGDFLATLEALRGNLPQDPGEIVDFLADAFVGVPTTLLAEPLALAEPVVGRLETTTQTLAGSDVPAQLATLQDELAAAAGVLVAFDPSVEDGFQLAIGRLEAARAALRAVTEGVRAGVGTVAAAADQIDLGAFERDYRAAIIALPQLEVVGLDELRRSVLAPLEEVSRALATTGSDTLAEQLGTVLGILGEALEQSGLDAWRKAILGFFEDVRGLVDQIDLAGVQTSVQGAFDAVDQGLRDLGATVKDDLVAAVRGILDEVETAVARLDLIAVETSVRAVLEPLDEALSGLAIPDLRAELDTVLQTLDGLIAELADLTAVVGKQLSVVVSELADLQFEPVTSPVIGQIESVTSDLRKIDAASLGTLERIALTAATAVLKAVDFQLTITDALLGVYDEAASVTKEPLETLAARLDGLRDRVIAFDPETLVEPLAATYQQIAGPITTFQATTLLRPVTDALDQAKSGFSILDPRQLAAPLTALFEPVRQSLDALSPTDLLRPVVEVFDQFEEALRAVDLTAVFDELTTLLNQLFTQVQDTLIEHVRSSGLPTPITDLLETLVPLLDLISPAALTDPAASVLDLLDTAMDRFKPGDVFRPLQLLYDDLLALLGQVADDVLVAGFEQVRQALVTALARVDPASLAGAVPGLLAETAIYADALDPAALRATAAPLYQALAVAFAQVDEASVPPPLQPLYDQVQGLVAGLDPGPALGALDAEYQAARALLAGVGTLALDDLSAVFAPLHQQITGLIPEFLRQPVTVETIMDALEALRPDAIAAEVDAVFAEVKTAFTTVRPVLGTTLLAFADQHRDRLALFDLGFLADEFAQVYAAITAKLAQLDPAQVIAAIQTTFDTVRQQVTDLDPVFLTDALVPTYQGIRDKLDALTLDAVEDTLDTLLSQVQATVESLDPADALRDAGLLETFAQLQKALAGVSAVAVVAELDRSLAALRAELISELRKTESKFEEMVDAIPV